MKPHLLFAAFFVLAGFAFTQNLSLTARAHAGDSIAMMELSEAFSFGKGVKQNDDSAMIWATRAAKAGNVTAQYFEGLRLTREIYSPKKFKEGILWLEKAAAKQTYC